ncbi:MAG: phosphoribosylamine--glycine ligase [Phycisphaeraceae bacterium]|nr:phosphoribosylamine--glycine ligase [Phycisphaeraceae bacterium]
MPDPSPSRTNVLLIGGGGREHALALRLAQSPNLGELWTSHPSNPGLAAIAKPVDVPVDARELYRLEQFCQKRSIGLVVIGPEDPLAEGFADRLASPTTLVFGPTAAGARLESDKAWCKQLLRAASIPTADARAFSDFDAACQHLESRASDDEDVAIAVERFATLRDAALRRKLIDAMVRVGKARLASQPIAASDITLLKNSAHFKDLFRDQAPDAAAIAAHCVPLAQAYARVRPDLPVIKASGLAKGKGVVVPDTLEQAVLALERMLVKREFGPAGAKVLIEERLEGPEVSVLAITDGSTLLMLPPCQDHKRLGDNDTGPNTGGMGAFCPSPRVDDDLLQRVERDILIPTLDALRRDDIDYRGVLYAGIMLTPGGPKVLEFNARFGDPETQPLMARLDADLLDILLHAARGTLDHAHARWDPRPACTIVLASQGYPEKPRTGRVITGLDEAAAIQNATIHHAGTRREGNDILTAGGRVLGVTALGDTLADARHTAYRAADLINFEGKLMRRDIALHTPTPPRRTRQPTP